MAFLVYFDDDQDCLLDAGAMASLYNHLQLVFQAKRRRRSGCRRQEATYWQSPEPQQCASGTVATEGHTTGFMSIKAACDIRMQSQNQMHRLSDICSNLPVDYDSEHHGFHQFCYKSFTNTAHVKAALHKSPKSLSAAQKSPMKCRKRPSAAATETLNLLVAL